MSEPLATYRLQLRQEFGFADAAAIVPYLRDLGVSHLYCSPILTARAGSPHGYDVIDPTTVSAERGGEEGFQELAAAGLALVIDVVPNHLAREEANRLYQNEALRHVVFDVDEHGFERRFFDVDDLVGVRVEDEKVFEITHAKILDLYHQGLIDGVRIDHVDGLADPTGYLDRLVERGVEDIWVEKILQSGERLPRWPVKGTTGYEFIADVTRLFVNPDAATVLDELAGSPPPFHETAYAAKLEQVRTTFARELAKLESLYRVEGLDLALARLPVYRSYVSPTRREVSEQDRAVTAALPEATRRAILLEVDAPPEFVTRFQQTTPPLMAKGVEDTALYRDVRLLALNEVGSDPGLFSLPVKAFHAENLARAASFPQTLLPATTHDTKRSGDVRARLIALSDVADEWSALARRWHDHAHVPEGQGPDWNEELFVYQTLVGGYPIDGARLSEYLTKALREAKVHTCWTDPDEAYEDAVIEFAMTRLCDPTFRASFDPFVVRIARAGERIALAQTVLRFSVPGVPDLYQGDETWNYVFVDPDNRRLVDWPARIAALARLRRGERITRENAKLFVTTFMLDLRARETGALSSAGSYEPLPSAETTCAFVRGDAVVVAVSLRDEPVSFEMPPGSWANGLKCLNDLYGRDRISCYVRADRPVR